MNWKGFLKSDWRNIVIAATIFAAWFLLLYTYSSGLFCSCGGPCPNGNYRDYVIIHLCPCCVSLSDLLYNYLWTLILPLMIAYIISCLIVWVYGKFRKKKEDYVHIKDVNMVMGQLEKWGNKKKK